MKKNITEQVTTVPFQTETLQNILDSQGNATNNNFIHHSPAAGFHTTFNILPG